MKVSLYVQIEPRWGEYRFNRDELQTVRVAKVTKTRPDEPLPGCIVTKVTLDVPADCFEMQAVEADVPVPSAIRAVS